jgi:uncharacterized protein
MESDTRAGLLRWNPWLERPERWEAASAAHIPKGFVARAPAGFRDTPRRGRALIVVGPRQAGKSTFLWDLVRARHDRALYVHGEDPVLASWCRSPALFAADLDELPEPLGALFIDEAPRLESAGLFIKGLIDLKLDLPIYVTGSSSFHLDAQVRESLAGRATRLRLYPFSLPELLANEVGEERGVRRAAAGRRIWERQMLVGGYPEVFRGTDEAAELYDLVQAFILRDASDRFRIRRPEAFRKLLQLLASQVGGVVNHSEWAALCGVAVTTVQDYLAIMEECHVARLLPVFAGGRRLELTASPKAFLVDNGLRNFLTSDFSALEARADRGALLESWVFSELLKATLDPADLHHWRTQGGAEVDFVLSRAGQAPTAIEAKWQGRVGRLTRGARSFLQAYTPERFITVTLAQEGEAEIEGTRCVWVHPWNLTDTIPVRYRSLPDIG